MPDLPTITVTQAQADRMMAAYGSVANYKLWLKQAIINQVIVIETQNLKTTHRQAEQDLAAQANEALS